MCGAEPRIPTKCSAWRLRLFGGGSAPLNLNGTDLQEGGFGHQCWGQPMIFLSVGGRSPRVCGSPTSCMMAVSGSSEAHASDHKQPSVPGIIGYTQTGE